MSFELYIQLILKYYFNIVLHFRANYNSMEKTLFDIEKDLEDKENTLEIDSRNLEIRTPLTYACPKQRNIALTKMSDAICPPCPKRYALH